MPMPARLAPYVRQFKAQGWSPEEVRAAIGRASTDSLAECADGCEVEPDGTCEHGCVSAPAAFGMI